MTPPPHQRPRRTGGNAPRPVRASSGQQSPQAGSAAVSPDRAASSSATTVPLWRLLTAVAGALQAIRGGQSGTAALAAVELSLIHI